MDKAANYRCIIRRLVREYTQYRASHGQIESIPVCDPKNDNYSVVHSGWDNIRRIHAPMVLIPYLLNTRSVDRELIRLGQLFNLLFTGGIIFRWLRKEFQLLPKAR